MTLARLALAVLAVTALFVGAAWAAGNRTRRVAAVAAAEALALTLLAALWFASLGGGGWLLVFALVGVLASGTDRWTRATAPPGAVRTLVVPALVVTLRYVVAGGVLRVILS